MDRVKKDVICINKKLRRKKRTDVGDEQKRTKDRILGNTGENWEKN